MNIAAAHSRADSSQVLGVAGRLAGKLLRPLPLESRKKLARWIVANNFPGRRALPLAMLLDWALKDPEGCHRFIWSNHLGDALTYEPHMRFGNENLRPSRRILLSDLTDYLRSRGIRPETDIGSVFDVGCSLGYVLRHLETDHFPSAPVLRGIDIDQHAIQVGTAYLKALSSKVDIGVGDMGELETILGDGCYDIILCCGTLLYLQPINAASAIASMLRHARCAVALSGLAHPDVDNSLLDCPAIRNRDGGFIHNFDRMVREAGGTVVFRRWGGRQLVQRHSVYFIIADPPPRPRSAHCLLVAPGLAASNHG